ncbi:DNA polymerase III subunit delta' [Thermanaerosceptrum fracticalcis]|uniref:DNA polymerase III subunit delta n=1 Tax=Thermanaerosceptrum fracticalcis TaxID=1712410 RepID=A0A7G6E5B3_THEFR|nr:DNA polymerase III subunit delta' [Thermanaerosceptrum fracticalcis]QNB47267.1 DNA polymerase III subunit delta' [Thermanaerosceptrum fracticalcis]
MGFKEIKGQERAVAQLKAALTSGRISHAYLFYGPEGIGKAKTARIFARALTCENPLEGEPCEVCSNCRKANSGNHPDIREVSPDGTSLKISQIRNLQSEVYLKCYEGRFKVIIVHDAQLLTIEAANSLLKVLEEPPERTIFILLAQDVQNLPDTIRSRCLHIQFSPLDQGVISEILAEQGVAAKIPLSLGQGSVGKTLKLMERIDYQQLLLNISHLIGDLKRAGYREIFAWAESLEKDRELLKVTLELIANMYRDKLVRCTTGKEELLWGTDEFVEKEDNPQICLAILEEMNKVPLYLKHNVNLRLVLEMLLIKLKNIEREERRIDSIG